MTSALFDWHCLVENVNGRSVVGQAGVRDPEYPCEEFTATGYVGHGTCHSDGHYLCVECSHLSPEAPRFTNDRAGRGDRLRLYWHRPGGPLATVKRSGP